MSRLGALARLPELASVEDCLKALEKSNGEKSGVGVRAWHSGQKGTQAVRMTSVSPAEALKLYRADKATVVIDSLHLFLPKVRELTERVAKDLGVGLADAGCNLYASPPGEGTRMHFDQQEIFLLQLRGRKRWTYAPVSGVKFPPVPYFGPGPLHPALARILSSPLPKRMPRNARTAILRPGSVLFLPRGTWHASQALDDSLGITLTYPTLSWSQLVLRRLTRELLGKEAWREPVVGVAGTAKTNQSARAKLEALLGDLQGIVGSLSPKDLLRAGIFAGARGSRPPNGRPRK